eukprot:CAMPEP_0184742704 /NCGR_PEP_ID=MMETSP0315-20130426/5656_1 /TAXON_ID=101924 /ORGANISM="Rhodosorus marinus, Strain UTEX LB 2760" /LENGTH=749 /DNA_ID=CAMNT_0027213665 /DNA_START=61 /DNA_END=2310 /DNA_ORIENTATION=-
MSNGDEEKSAVMITSPPYRTDGKKWSGRLGLPSDSVLLGKFSCIFLGKIPIKGSLLVFDSAVAFFSKLVGTFKEIWPREQISHVSTVKKGVKQLVLVMTSGVQNCFVAFENKNLAPAFLLVDKLLNEQKDTGGGLAPSAGSDSSRTELTLEQTLDEGDLTSLTPAVETEPGSQPGDTQYLEAKDRADSSEDETDQIDSAAGGEEDYMWIQKGDIIDYKHGKAYANRKQVLQMRLHINARDLFAYIYTDGANAYREFHEAKMGDWDVKITDWLTVGGHRERRGSFTKKLQYSIGPKQTRVEEKSFLSFTSDGFRLESDLHNRDVPLGDSFRVESFFEFHNDGAEYTICTVDVAINFLTRNLLRNRIESGTLNETPLTYAKLLEFYTEGARKQVAEKNQRRLALAPRAAIQLSQRSDASDSGVPQQIALDVPASNLPGTAESHSAEDAEAVETSAVQWTTVDEPPAEDLYWAADGLDVFNKPKLQTYRERQEVARDVMPCPPKAVLAALFYGKGAEELYHRYFQIAGEHESIMKPWEYKDGHRTRELTYKKPLSIAMVNKVVQCYETHYLSFSNGGGFLYEVELYNPDVPTGASFRVQSFWEFSPKGTDATEVRSSVAVRWVGKSMFKNRIEKGAVADVTVSYAKLLKIAQAMCSAFATKAKPSKVSSNAKSKVGSRSKRPTSAKRTNPTLQKLVEDEEIEEVHDASSLAMNVILILSFLLILWLLVTVLQVSNTVSAEIAFLHGLLGPAS